MQTNECVIGIDIGGTTTSFGFIDRHGALLSEETLATLAHQPAESLVSRLYDAIEKLCTTLSPQTIFSGIGIGAPNANYLRGTVENPVNLNWG
ncbi:MAG: ROK family protein, partial [Desulfuromonadaceae bacterium]|nr:ROK family protein [Desulfuromonadaceae bacterium]